MAVRAMWKGTLELADATVPVKLYAAARDTAVRFHLVHVRDQTRVKQRWVHPKTGDEVPASDIQKGYAIDPGTLVVLDDKALSTLAPAASRAIEVTHALPTGSLIPAWFERPYYLGPDGTNAAYFALADVMQRKQRDVLVRWVMRRKRYRGLVRSEGQHLMLFTLHAHDELLAPPELKRIPARELAAQELALAEQLVAGLHGTFDPKQWRSSYDDRVRELLEQKAKGRRAVLRSVKKADKPSGTLERALKQSVAQLRHGPRESRDAKERKSA